MLAVCPRLLRVAAVPRFFAPLKVRRAPRSARCAARLLLASCGIGSYVMVVGQSPTLCASETQDGPGSERKDEVVTKRDLEGVTSKLTSSDDDGADTLFDRLLVLAAPLAGQVGFGSVAGYCAGHFVRTGLKQVAYAVGGLFAVAQLAAYKGFIEIKWNSIRRKVEAAADVDGDGQFGVGDLRIYFRRLVRVLQHQFPGGTGFMAGFTYALL